MNTFDNRRAEHGEDIGHGLPGRVEDYLQSKWRTEAQAACNPSVMKIAERKKVPPRITKMSVLKKEDVKKKVFRQELAPHNNSSKEDKEWERHRALAVCLPTRPFEIVVKNDILIRKGDGKKVNKFKILPN